MPQPTVEVLRFPDIPLREWIELWKCGYDKRYGGGPDLEYAGLMDGVHSARDFASTLKAVEAFFEWKDRFRNRWTNVVRAVDKDRWNRLKTQQEMPSFWTNGVVYNVFLWHVATRGLRPLIDQHSWRAYCWLTARREKPEFTGDRIRGMVFYAEFESWFNETAGTYSERRDLDRALMAFGQFCSVFPCVIHHYFECPSKTIAP